MGNPPLPIRARFFLRLKNGSVRMTPLVEELEQGNAAGSGVEDSPDERGDG